MRQDKLTISSRFNDLQIVFQLTEKILIFIGYLIKINRCAAGTHGKFIIAAVLDARRNRVALNDLKEPVHFLVGQVNFSLHLFCNRNKSACSNKFYFHTTD